jgi:hypothetical protein
MKFLNIDSHLGLVQSASRALAGGRRGVGILGLFVVVGLAAAAAPVRKVAVGALGDISAATGVDWIVEAEDSVCGVHEARQIQKPAKVRFDHLVAITPEGRKLKRDRIDPDSAEGVRLTNRAKSRVRDAASVIMKRQGFDSVWKRISSRKGAYIVDVTAYVEIEIDISQRSSTPP